MARPIDEIDFAAMTAPERLLLAQELLDSVLSEATPLTPEQLADLEARARGIDSGKEPCEDWEIVKQRLLRNL